MTMPIDDLDHAVHDALLRADRLRGMTGPELMELLPRNTRPWRVQLALLKLAGSTTT